MISGLVLFVFLVALNLIMMRLVFRLYLKQNPLPHHDPTQRYMSRKYEDALEDAKIWSVFWPFYLIRVVFGGLFKRINKILSKIWEVP